MKEKPIIVMLAYARCGGTLLNRCLANMPSITMLSEVNIEARCPSSCNTIRDQAKKWYGIDLVSDEFIENIGELYSCCLKNDKTLVVRDWSFGSFVPSRYNNHFPSKRLATLDAISSHYVVKPFVFVRNAIDVWLSFNASTRTFYDKDLSYFYSFATETINRKIRIFKYEDFCLNPAEVMRSICNYAGMHYSELFMHYSDYFKVTGDTDLPDQSRGVQKGKIELLARREMPDELFKKIITQTKAKEINKLFGYRK